MHRNQRCEPAERLPVETREVSRAASVGEFNALGIESGVYDLDVAVDDTIGVCLLKKYRAVSAHRNDVVGTGLLVSPGPAQARKVLIWGGLFTAAMIAISRY